MFMNVSILKVLFNGKRFHNWHNLTTGFNKILDISKHIIRILFYVEGDYYSNPN